MADAGAADLLPHAVEDQVFHYEHLPVRGVAKGGARPLWLHLKGMGRGLRTRACHQALADGGGPNRRVGRRPPVRSRAVRTVHRVRRPPCSGRPPPCRRPAVDLRQQRRLRQGHGLPLLRGSPPSAPDGSALGRHDDRVAAADPPGAPGAAPQACRRRAESGLTNRWVRSRARRALGRQRPSRPVRHRVAGTCTWGWRVASPVPGISEVGRGRPPRFASLAGGRLLHHPDPRGSLRPSPPTGNLPVAISIRVQTNSSASAVLTRCCRASGRSPTRTGTSWRETTGPWS